MKKPLVSVIIPCYNYGEFLAECVNSVLTQTYTSIEVIIINDGSTDNTDICANNLASLNKNIRYIKQSNLGIIKTRNKGVELSKGDYLLQLDADDILDQTYIEKTVEMALEKKADIVYTQTFVFGRIEFTTSYPEFNLEYLKHENFIHASALVNKSIFKDRQYDDYLDDKGNEDWDVFLDACMDGAEAVLLNEPLLKYRKHTDGKSRADKFEGTYIESLVRHHILSKQNAKHPKQMWYFSSEITSLKKQIDYYSDYQKLQEKLKREEQHNINLANEITVYRQRIERIEATYAYRVYQKLKRLRSKTKH